MCEGAHNTYMNDIREILNLSTEADKIQALKQKNVFVPCWSDLRKEYEPTEHAIVKDTTTRKDKIKANGVVDKASRIYIGLEKLLTNRMSEFTFAIPVKRIYSGLEDKKSQEIGKALEMVYKHARTDAENLRRAKEYYASCEICTIWYVVPKNNKLYGFDSKFKLKCKTFSPMNGVRLYPLFDEYGDMVAMSLEYDVAFGEDKTTYFETYTAERHLKWKQDNFQHYELIQDIENPIGKIPCVYMSRPEPIYGGLSYLRNEIEYTLSRNSDTIAYNSAPILKVSGSLQGEESKGESKRVFRVENGGDVAYISWAQSIEALKYHVNTLVQQFWAQSQMPDISFENMKGLGNIGFDARQTLLTDAHLKVGDEQGAWVEFFEREANIIKAFLSQMNTNSFKNLDDVEVEHIITPFIQNDEKATIERLVTANGGKPILSQLEAIKLAGYSSDPESTLKAIEEAQNKELEAKTNVSVSAF